MNIDSEVSALLSLAMSAPSKARKAACLALAEALRTRAPMQPPEILADAAESRHGPGVGAEVLVLAREFGLTSGSP